MDIDVDNSILVNSSLFTNILEKLNTEKYILHKLLYRNHNQHRKTKLFRSFIRLNKKLKNLTSERLTTLNTYADKSIRISKKTTARDLHDVLLCMKDLYNTVNVALNICLLCNTSSSIVSKQLKQHLFIPLYSVFLAISARLLKITSSIVSHFHNLLLCLTTQMKHTSLTQSRFSQQIELTLKEIEFSTWQLNNIYLLRSLNFDIESNINNSSNNNKRSHQDIISKESEDIGEYISNSAGMEFNYDYDKSSEPSEPLSSEIISDPIDDSIHSKRKMASYNFNNNNNNNNNKKFKVQR